MLQDVLSHLEKLVSFDTRNPPREIGTGGIFDYLRLQLAGFEITVTDHGAGAVSMLAVRGSPRRVFNVHLDTVPSSEAWTADPHVMRRFDDRVANGLSKPGVVTAVKIRMPLRATDGQCCPCLPAPAKCKHPPTKPPEGAKGSGIASRLEGCPRQSIALKISPASGWSPANS